MFDLFFLTRSNDKSAPSMTDANAARFTREALEKAAAVVYGVTTDDTGVVDAFRKSIDVVTHANVDFRRGLSILAAGDSVDDTVIGVLSTVRESLVKGDHDAPASPLGVVIAQAVLIDLAKSRKVAPDTSNYVPPRQEQLELYRQFGKVPEGYLDQSMVKSISPDLADDMVRKGLPLVKASFLESEIGRRVATELFEKSERVAAFVEDSKPEVLETLLDMPAAGSYDLLETYKAIHAIHKSLSGDKTSEGVWSMAVYKSERESIESELDTHGTGRDLVKAFGGDRKRLPTKKVRDTKGRMQTVHYNPNKEERAVVSAHPSPIGGVQMKRTPDSLDDPEIKAAQRAAAEAARQPVPTEPTPYMLQQREAAKQRAQAQRSHYIGTKEGPIAPGGDRFVPGDEPQPVHAKPTEAPKEAPKPTEPEKRVVREPGKPADDLTKPPELRRIIGRETWDEESKRKKVVETEAKLKAAQEHHDNVMRSEFNEVSDWQAREILRRAQREHTVARKEYDGALQRNMSLADYEKMRGFEPEPQKEVPKSAAPAAKPAEAPKPTPIRSEEAKPTSKVFDFVGHLTSKLGFSKERLAQLLPGFNPEGHADEKTAASAALDHLETLLTKRAEKHKAAPKPKSPDAKPKAKAQKEPEHDPERDEELEEERDSRAAAPYRTDKKRVSKQASDTDVADLKKLIAHLATVAGQPDRAAKLHALIDSPTAEAKPAEVAPVAAKPAEPERDHIHESAKKMLETAQSLHVGGKFKEATEMASAGLNELSRTGKAPLAERQATRESLHKVWDLANKAHTDEQTRQEAAEKAKSEAQRKAQAEKDSAAKAWSAGESGEEQGKHYTRMRESMLPHGLRVDMQTSNPQGTAGGRYKALVQDSAVGEVGWLHEKDLEKINDMAAKAHVAGEGSAEHKALRKELARHAIEQSTKHLAEATERAKKNREVFETHQKLMEKPGVDRRIESKRFSKARAAMEDAENDVHHHTKRKEKWEEHAASIDKTPTKDRNAERRERVKDALSGWSKDRYAAIDKLSKDPESREAAYALSGALNGSAELHWHYRKMDPAKLAETVNAAIDKHGSAAAGADYRKHFETEAKAGVEAETKRQDAERTARDAAVKEQAAQAEKNKLDPEWHKQQMEKLKGLSQEYAKRLTGAKAAGDTKGMREALELKRGADDTHADHAAQYKALTEKLEKKPEATKPGVAQKHYVTVDASVPGIDSTKGRKAYYAASSSGSNSKWTYNKKDAKAYDTPEDADKLALSGSLRLGWKNANVEADDGSIYKRPSVAGKPADAPKAEAAKPAEAPKASDRQFHHKFKGGVVTEDFDKDRIQVRHDAKPDKETVAKLKHKGFHWSPPQGVWQRKLTDNARSDTDRLFGTDTRGEHARRKEAAPVTGQAAPAPRVPEVQGPQKPVDKTPPGSLADLDEGTQKQIAEGHNADLKAHGLSVGGALTQADDKKFGRYKVPIKSEKHGDLGSWHENTVKGLKKNLQNMPKFMHDALILESAKGAAATRLRNARAKAEGAWGDKDSKNEARSAAEQEHRDAQANYASVSKRAEEERTKAYGSRTPEEAMNDLDREMSVIKTVGAHGRLVHPDSVPNETMVRLHANELVEHAKKMKPTDRKAMLEQLRNHTKNLQHHAARLSAAGGKYADVTAKHEMDARTGRDALKEAVSTISAMRGSGDSLRTKEKKEKPAVTPQHPDTLKPEANQAKGEVTDHMQSSGYVSGHDDLGDAPDKWTNGVVHTALEDHPTGIGIPGQRRGVWGVHKMPSGSMESAAYRAHNNKKKDDRYVVTHHPTGMRAHVAKSEASAMEFVNHIMKNHPGLASAKTSEEIESHMRTPEGKETMMEAKKKSTWNKD